MLALLGVCFALLFPSFDWYSKDAVERDRLEASRMRPKHLLNLGLDLKGGTHLLMELDVAKLPEGADMNDALLRAIEIIRNRIDQFGVAEALIARQGERNIVVQLPGITNSRQAKELVGKTALLEFRMVDESESGRKAAQKLSEMGELFVGGKPKPEALKLLPPGMALFPGKEYAFHIVTDKAPLTGALLDSAKVDTGDNGLPVVGFRFKPEGGKIFAELTSANVGRSMAIILDGAVYSAPVIKGPIRGGSGIIEGNFRMEDARALAIVLRAGALPAPVAIIEERTVGASLGEDSIKAGLYSSLAGAIAILGFLALYYKLSGVMADLSLATNLFMMLALMAYFGSTLTLPGVAGIVLTMAMSVDANVLIFERIKEEIASGKPLRLALDAGYDKAATAIFDSNITLLVAGVLLFQFGTGPIKGFAVTLTLGNLISMFTATVVTRLMHESWVVGGERETLSI